MVYDTELRSVQSRKLRTCSFTSSIRKRSVGGQASSGYDIRVASHSGDRRLVNSIVLISHGCDNDDNGCKNPNEHIYDSETDSGFYVRLGEWIMKVVP